MATVGSVGAAMEDDFMDPILDNLNKEIAELRERRITHNLNKARLLDDDDFDEDFESAFFTEQILGELGSSSSSHKNQRIEIDDDEEQKGEDDQLTYLSADSGASD